MISIVHNLLFSQELFVRNYSTLYGKQSAKQNMVMLNSYVPFPRSCELVVFTKPLKKFLLSLNAEIIPSSTPLITSHQPIPPKRDRSPRFQFLTVIISLLYSMPSQETTLSANGCHAKFVGVSSIVLASLTHLRRLWLNIS